MNFEIVPSKWKAIYIIVLTVVTAFCMSCSLRKDKGVAEIGVAKFHSQFNNKQYRQIYDQTDEGFRKQTSEQQLTEYMEAVHRKLGEVKDAKQVRWRANVTTAGTQVFLAYQTAFAEGNATEDFVFIVDDDSSRLFKYNIQSPTLIIK
jgi:hypothetical protein